ncbi:hypothetical protein JW921_10430 [Candidatus Fermentibacterales bacterium]|nr:hypothetical protein [Candidatus Fermentibacterales bacterium]
MISVPKRSWKACGFGAVLLPLVALSLSPLMPPQSFWSMDEGNRFLQVVSLSGRFPGIQFSLPPRVEYPGGGLIQPEGLRERVRPLPYQYGSYSDGVLYSQYGPALALVSVPFFTVFGQRGIYLLPAVFSALLGTLAAACLVKRGFSPARALLLAATGLPLAFFGLTFWSHSLALFIALCSVRLARSGSLTGAFLLAGLAVLFRAEMLPLLVLLPFLQDSPSSPTLLRPFRSLLRAAPGALCALVLLAAILKLMTGQWLGTHVAASGAEVGLYGHAGMGWLPERLFVLGRSLLSALPPAFGGETVSVLLGAFLWVVWLVALRAGEEGRLRLVLVAAGAVVSVGVCVVVTARGLASMDLLGLKHPLVLFPVLWLARPSRRHALEVLFLFLALLLLLRPMHVEDLAWGLRHMLLPVVLLALTASPRIRRRGLCLVLLACFCTTATSVGALMAKRWRSQELIGRVERAGSVLVTTSWEQPQEFSGLIAESRPVFMADRTADLADLLESLHDDGGAGVVLLCRRQSSSTALGVLDALPWAEARLAFEGCRLDPLLDLLGFEVRFD